MTLRFAPIAAALLFLPACSRAQNTPAPPPPPPPLLDATQASAFAQNGTLLRYQFEPGEFSRYRVTTDTTNFVTSGKQDASVATKQHVEAVIRETVRDIRFPEGIATLILQPESLKIVTNGKAVVLSQDQRDALLQQRELQMTPTGKIIDAPSGTNQARRTMDPLIYGFLNTQSAFPPDSVPSGGRWTTEWKFSDLGIPVKGVFSVAGVEVTKTGSVVRIQATLSETDRLKRSLAVTPTGEEIAGNSIILFDNTNGALAKSSVTLHARLPLSSPALNFRNAHIDSTELSPSQMVIDRKVTIERLTDSVSDTAQIQAYSQAETPQAKSQP